MFLKTHGKLYESTSNDHKSIPLLKLTVNSYHIFTSVLYSPIPTSSLKISPKCHRSTNELIALFLFLLEKSPEIWLHFPVSLKKLKCSYTPSGNLEITSLMLENKLLVLKMLWWKNTLQFYLIRIQD